MRNHRRQLPTPNSQRPNLLPLGVGSWVLGVFKRAFTAFVVVLAGSETLLACPHCVGAEETSLVDSTRLGVLVMLGITLAVQGAFVGFFFYLRKRARRIADVELEAEWSELQRSPRTS
jgi:hypothetical protein